MLNLSGIKKTFFPGTVNERRALRGIDLHLEQGDFVTVIGSNGAGKSTLLNAIAGRLSVDEGTISIAGKDITRSKEHSRAAYVGRVFQDPMAGTAPNLTIEENLSLAYQRAKTRGLRLGLNSQRRAFFAEQLATLELGLEDRMTAKVGLLSGGQRQALSLLMAGFTHPQVMLLDEHTAALDPQRAELVTELTEKIVSQGQLTTLMVTHNMAQALAVGNRLIMMHEGSIIFSAAGAQKAALTVDALMAQFSSIKGAVSDRTLLQ